ncbi:hypothetical protein [Chitinivibrio alkaliphilus]|uniref:Uncharacterized protein n=1 Tax=Chitinivibrio alkaliphilus ACht1 TaxID=1313304 RepID=U7D4T3_9BACT|nr:hypothetical protein [Chitinivibrio alkaliphilus]ERP31524.1 hypothetical protein CALK_1569 [Chitinivibrio alkaliphilus ACht1]
MHGNIPIIQICLLFLLIGSAVYGQNIDSRQGDSLALVAIQTENRGNETQTSSVRCFLFPNDTTPSVLESLDVTTPITTWEGVSINSLGRVEALILPRLVFPLFREIWPT